MLTVLEPAASQDLTTVESARVEVGVTGSAEDAALAALIRQASADCARFCNRPGFGRERVRQIERTPGAAIILQRDLEPEILSVTVGDASVLTAEEWELDGAILSRPWAARCWAWPAPVVIEYRAGFELLATLPHDIERACLEIVRALWFARERDPTIRSTSTEGVGMTAFAAASPDDDGLPAGAARRLRPWRRLPGF